MPIIEIESAHKIEESFANNKVEGARWFTSMQPALLFKDGQKYPDKFELQLAFSANEQEMKSVQPFAVGRYHFDEDSYYIDNRNHCQLNANKLVLITK